MHLDPDPDQTRSGSDPMERRIRVQTLASSYHLLSGSDSSRVVDRMGVKESAAHVKSSEDKELVKLVFS